jgi:hypothetical protein
LEQSINFVADILDSIIDIALSTSSTGNSSTFNLADSAVHNVCEHDGSLSRNDYYFGDDIHFNGPIWDVVKAHFTQDVITIETAAKTRADRIAAAEAVNPDFNLTDTGRQNSIFETSLYLLIFGDRVEGNATTEWVNILFGKSFYVSFIFPLSQQFEPSIDSAVEQERIPYQEGFERTDDGYTTDDLNAMAAKVESFS